MIEANTRGLSGIAIDLGGTKTAVARIDQGKLVSRDLFATETGLDADALACFLVKKVQAMTISATDNVGVAVTGRVDEHGHWYAVNQATLSKVDKIPLQALLSKELGRPVAVINDALAGALAEHRFGAGAGSQRMAYLTVSTGVGSGILLDGVPLRSPRGLVGHSGFTSSRFATERCGSGRAGTVESVASGNAIARAAELAGYPGMTAKAVFAAHRNGERWASAIVNLSVAAIAELCADLVALLDIDRIVLGGSVGLTAGYRNSVQSVLATMPELFRVPVVPASLGSETVLFGALVSCE